VAAPPAANPPAFVSRRTNQRHRTAPARLGVSWWSIKWPLISGSLLASLPFLTNERLAVLTLTVQLHLLFGFRELDNY
jgi:hypothetical protein